ncbi:hypothetical protein DAEQUDRAFT_770168 [Daedalea quercina L-15889]|uniref:Uncharacterized protein n=1 Tax=Daedalea quercina L-15889 TaxID=1314783 RepID=A0A165L3Y1_9APHY|nr:hypothetical protein DAEQUDRAFT_770168 [Daedalea quercina L-15889]
MVKAAGNTQQNTPLVVVLFRDGTAYFVTILLLSATNTALVLSSATDFNGILNIIIYPLQVILLSHFFLNLREVTESHAVGGYSAGSSQLSELNFERVVGRLAGSISYNTDDSVAGETNENELEPIEEIEGVQTIDAEDQEI